MVKRIAIGSVLASVAFLVAAVPAGEAVNPYFKVPPTWEHSILEGDEDSFKAILIGPSTASAESVDDTEVDEDGLLLEENVFPAVKVERRPAISLSDLGEVTDAKLRATIIGDQKTYQAGRKEFLKDVGGKVLEFMPWKKDYWMSGAEVVETGVKYALADTEFFEKSYFVSCKNRVYLIQSLLSDEKFDDYNDVTNEIVRSFKCE